MIYPNKHITIEDSIIYKMLAILEAQEGYEMNIHVLYSKTKQKFNNADEFILSLDVLYLLDMIEVEFETETIRYVKRDKL